MSNLLTSLAFIKANVDSGISIWDSLTRLMLNVIREKSLTDVSSESFCDEFKQYYNVNIPLHPMNTIIGKLKNYGIIDDEYGRWKIKISKIDNISIKTQNQEKFENLINELKKYMKGQFNIDKDYNNAEEIFLGFINIYDSELLYSLETKSILPEVAVSSADMYMISSFIEWIVKSNSSFYNILEDILLANIHLNSIFIIEKDRKIKLNRVFVYLDTRFILRLTGIEGKFRKDEYSYLLDILINNNCNLRIFDVHYNEVIEILKDCVKWLENKQNYNPKYASRALRYFVEHNYKVSDVLACQAQVDTLKLKYKIGIDVHNYEDDELNQYTIDESKLFEIIKRMYSENSINIDSYNMEGMIWNDVKAISAIYKKRKGFNANSLQNIKAIFITNNKSLSRAVKEFNISINRSEKYNECVTDTYWGTAIWLNTAYKENAFYAKKLIADSISITEINPKLKERFLNNIKEKKEKGEYSDSEYYLLREYPGVNQYLKDATFNNDEEYNDSLPEEILEHFQDEIKKPLEEIIAKNDAQIRKRSEELMIFNQRDENQRLKIDKIAKSFSFFVIFICCLLINIPSVILTITDLAQNPIRVWIIRILFFIISVFLGICGFYKFPISNKLYEYKKRKLLKEWGMNN